MRILVPQTAPPSAPQTAPQTAQQTAPRTAPPFGVTSKFTPKILLLICESTECASHWFHAFLKVKIQCRVTAKSLITFASPTVKQNTLIQLCGDVMVE